MHTIKCILVTAMCLSVAFSDQYYYKSGDINLGVLTSVHNAGGKDDVCGHKIVHPRRMQYIEIVVYTLREINARKDILPNITIGFVVLDDCDKPSTAIATSLRFLPLHHLRSKVSTSDQCQAEYDTFDVVGIVGPYSSTSAMLVSPLLGYYGIPQISAMATSEDLSKKGSYKYFLRVVPPDQFQAMAMISLIRHFKWSYVSVVYYGSTYGRNAKRKIDDLIEDLDICIAYSREIPYYATTARYEDTVQALLNAEGARVVLLFLYPEQGKALLTAAKKLNAYGRFIWVGSEAFDLRAYTDLEDIAVGAFWLSISLPEQHPFEKYFESLTPENNEVNPWYAETWNDTFNCWWENKTCQGRFPNITLADRYFVSPWNYMIMDSVLTYAYGLDALIRNECPNATGADARNCVNGNVLLDYLRDVNFEGTTGPISFDSNGDINGRYAIMHLVKTEHGYDAVEIGQWSRLTNNITIRTDQVQFSVPTKANETPTSVCSFECPSGHYYVNGNVPCCWDCLPCRTNEIVSKNKTYCDPCPLFTWPDATVTGCLIIEPKFLQANDLIGVFIVLLSVVCLILSLVGVTVFCRNLKRKVIKSSSYHIMFLLLFAVAVNCIMAVTFVLPINSVICYLRIAGFHLACTMLYGPLCVKTIRIYRFFAAASKCKTRLKCVSPYLTLVHAAFIITSQVVLILMLMLVYPPESSRHQPVEVEKYVELRCVTPAVSFLAPLTLNILLLVACATFGFLTRKLPDCFNESLCIFFSVVTTLVVWAAFLPTYYLMFYAYYKDMLLALALLLNCFVFLFGLFGPKIYAVYFIEDTNIKTSNYEAEVSKITQSVRIKDNGSTLSIPSEVHKITHKDNHNGSNPTML